MVDVTHAAEPPSATPLAAALDEVGDRWSLLLVEALLDGPRRFSELAEAVPAIAPNILADRLRRLGSIGVLVGRPYSERPVRLAYELTAEGRALAGALRLLSDWGARHGVEAADGRPADRTRHEACGSPLEVAWYCPTCERVVTPGEAPETRSV
jgi:DNA-binding HxlR family transcriptional regulator